MAASIKSLVVLCLMSLISISTYAQTKVVVIPMGSDAKPLQNVITVSKENGDFTDPVEAMKSISDADENNRYLLLIGPGEYTLTEELAMQEYVDISGSGQNGTKLIGNRVRGSNNSEISSLTIENITSGDSAHGFYNGNTSPIMSDMTIVVSGLYSYGVYNSSSSSPTMSNININMTNGTGVINVSSSSPSMTNIRISISGSGGSWNTGVFNWRSAAPRMSNMDISVTGTYYNVGILNRESNSPTMSNIHIAVSGGTNSYGVYNRSSCSPAMSEMKIKISGASTDNHGVRNLYSGDCSHIRNSTISASGGTSARSVYAGTSSGANETYVSDSILSGAVQGSPVCSFTFSNTGTNLTADCIP